MSFKAPNVDETNYRVNLKVSVLNNYLCCSLCNGYL